jgi:4-oxalocrotonate tautomerase
MPLIQVTLIEGRSKETKSALIRALTEATVKAIDAPAAALRVIIQEVPADNWGVGGIPKSLKEIMQ